MKALHFIVSQIQWVQAPNLISSDHQIRIYESVVCSLGFDPSPTKTTYRDFLWKFPRLKVFSVRSSSKNLYVCRNTEVTVQPWPQGMQGLRYSSNYMSCVRYHQRLVMLFPTEPCEPQRSSQCGQQDAALRGLCWAQGSELIFPLSAS